MSNFLRRREEREAAPLSSLVEPFIQDPFRAVRGLLRRDPFREMESVMPGWAERGYLPEVDVKDSKDALIFKVDLPGVRDADVEVSVSGNRLTISGKRDEEETDEGDRYYAYERAYGSFTRTFTLPEGADAEHVKADLHDGVLTLVVPKKTEGQAKRIPIEGQSKETHAHAEGKPLEAVPDLKKAA